MNIRLLMVDDDSDDRLLVRDLLNEIDDATFRFVEAASYEEGIAAFTSESFDVCLFDYNLGGNNGIELLEMFNGLEHDHTPVILLTGVDDPSIDLKAIDSGAADFLVKAGLNRRSLERSVRFALRRRRHDDELSSVQQGLAQENAVLQYQLSLDSMTGLTNHNAFKERLAEEFQSTDPAHRPLTVIMVDVDAFKRYNDDFGHQCGDAALIQIAEALQGASRSSDCVARYGGEEFGIILPDTALVEAVVIAERMKLAIELGRWPNRPITANSGVAARTAGSTPETLLAAADQALYRAKRYGRNRVVLADNGSTLVPDSLRAA